MFNKDELIARAYNNLSDRELYDVNTIYNRITENLIKGVELGEIYTRIMVKDEKVRSWVCYKCRKEGLWVKCKDEEIMVSIGKIF